MRTVSMSPKSKKKRNGTNKDQEMKMETSSDEFIMEETKKSLNHLETTTWAEERVDMIEQEIVILRKPL